MAWPLRGRILSGYGTKPDGQKNDGIDIAAAKGTPVKAAEAGTVVYAGSEAPRMGNLLLVSHASGYITAYAHNEALLVKKGDRVTKGQTIARVGNSGGVTEPQLHFEVRKDNRTIDPTQVLPQINCERRPSARLRRSCRPICTRPCGPRSRSPRRRDRARPDA